MAELPSKVHLTSQPICLRCGPSVYEDENDCTWLHHIMDREDVMQVWLCQEDIPSGDITITPSLLTSYTMTLMCTIYSGSQYVDHMCWFWLIVRPIMEDGVEKMVLELMEDS